MKDMARLLGRWQVPWGHRLPSGKHGCGECEMGHRYGRDRRIPKRREQRDVAREISEERYRDADAT
jgi:hypothetical protein